VLHSEVIWDNSADNFRNPNQPPARVKWGEATTDEMGTVRFGMVAANEKDTPALQRAIRVHALHAYRSALLRGEKFDLKKLGIESSPGPVPRRESARTDGQVPAGARALAFEDVQGRTQQPLGAEEAKASVLFFVTPDCPISNGYAPEINALVKEHAGRPLRFYVVHVDPDLKPDAARKHAESFGYRCPVLLDSKHQLVAATGVTTTPEVAVVTQDGAIVYRGRIDDRYPEVGVKRRAPTQRDLGEALAAVLAGKPVPTARTKAVGCVIPDGR
jgi:hypothetical protein